MTNQQAVRAVLLAVTVAGMLAPRIVDAEVYKYIENGVVHYSNRMPAKNLRAIKNMSAFSLVQPQSTSRVVQTRIEQPASDFAATTLPYSPIIYRVANAYQLSPELIKAIVKVESNYNHRAVSPKGAQGLMQLMPATAKRFGVDDSFDPEQNITGGAKFLRYLFNEFGENNLDLVLAGYNAGENAVRKHGNAIPPYAETKQYVRLVKSHYLPHAQYVVTASKKIYKYVDKNGVIAFTNIAPVK